MTPVRRVNAERLVVLGWGRAILMQVAHPLVASGVYAHSSVRAGGVQQIVRLHRTIKAMLDLVAGDEATARRAAAGIDAIHRRVRGTLEQPAGRHQAGTPYDARDPDLLLWVHATLTTTLPETYERLVGPLPPGAHDEYCREAAAGAGLLGLPPKRCPLSVSELEAYVDDMLTSGALAVTPAAKEVARILLHPPLAVSPWPLGRLHRLLTVGTLPAPLRAGYGLPFDDADRAALDGWCARVRRLRRRLPDVVALWPKMR